MLLLDQTSSIETLINRLLVTRLTAALIFIAAVVATAAIPRSSWPLNALTFLVATCVFLAIAGSRKHGDISFWIRVGIVARVAMIPIFPELSDDIYRFIWDGQMTLNGLNPYGVVPETYVNDSGITSGLLYEMAALMNSPRYFTVYPPLSQVLFAFSAWCGGESVYATTIVLKLFLLAGEIGSIILLTKVLEKKKVNAVLLYAMNPLVIIEVVGNVHFEGLMVFSLLMVAWLINLPSPWNVRRLISTAGAFALGIGVKLLPIALFPFLWKRLGTRRFFFLSGILLLLLAAMFIPALVTSGISGTSSSVGLYFQSFEFNASIYYLLRWLGYLWKGYNMISVIGLITGIGTLAIFAGLFFSEMKPTTDSWATVSLLALSAYLATSSIVHPWYIVPLVALSTMTTFRFPVLWSILAFLSYSAYSSSDYSENLWLVAMEYIPIYLLALYEVLSFRKIAA